MVFLSLFFLLTLLQSSSSKHPQLIGLVEVSWVPYESLVMTSIVRLFDYEFE